MLPAREENRCHQTPPSSHLLFGHHTNTEGSSCLVCERFRQQSRGGRPRRVESTQGRLGPLSPHTLWSAVKALGVKSLLSLYPSRFDIPATISLPDIQCSLCDILDSPVQLLCGKMACGERIVKQGEKHDAHAVTECTITHPEAFGDHQMLYSRSLGGFLFSATSQAVLHASHSKTS